MPSTESSPKRGDSQKLLWRKRRLKTKTSTNSKNQKVTRNLSIKMAHVEGHLTARPLRERKLRQSETVELAGVRVNTKPPQLGR